MSRPPTPVADRLWPRVDKREDGCWIFTGALNADGYGHIGVGQKVLRVHRVAYELLVGPIPVGLHLDHLCRNRACCNPEHLEPVTNRENWIRGHHATAVTVATGTCQRGHDMATHQKTRPNGSHYCYACQVIRNEARAVERQAV